MMFAQHITPNFRARIGKTPAPNKAVAIMAADVNALTSALRKNSSDYPQYSLLETATIAIAKTLGACE
jgi:hypothetical protein